MKFKYMHNENINFNLFYRPAIINEKTEQKQKKPFFFIFAHNNKFERQLSQSR